MDLTKRDTAITQAKLLLRVGGAPEPVLAAAREITSLNDRHKELCKQREDMFKGIKNNGTKLKSELDYMLRHDYSANIKDTAAALADFVEPFAALKDVSERADAVDNLVQNAAMELLYLTGTEERPKEIPF